MTDDSRAVAAAEAHPSHAATTKAAWLIVLASFLFATMGVCVKLGSAQYHPGEIVFYRGLVGAALMALLARQQRGSLATRVPTMHLWRSVAGVTAQGMWFYTLAALPIATAMTLNYMSSVWMALFMFGGAAMLGTARLDFRLLGTVLLGFGGVALVLRPTIDAAQLWYGLIGVFSGMISALAYLQVAALGRAGEPEYRVVFYFSVGGMALGALTIVFTGLHALTFGGIALLLAVGLLASAAQLMMTRAFSIGHKLVNASLQYLGIVFSFAYGIVLFDDRLTWPGVAGIVLIIGAGLSATMLRGSGPAKETLATTSSDT
ncbi:MAG: DMT family transporter [Proteobacteria bacterium]|nr:DMT family transporter [Pseudomonadota bacterium]